MKKKYIAPQIEDVQLDALMVEYLGVATGSATEQIAD